MVSLHIPLANTALMATCLPSLAKSFSLCVEPEASGGGGDRWSQFNDSKKAWISVTYSYSMIPLLYYKTLPTFL